MADSVLFNGTTGYMQFSPGQIVGSGALSAAVIVKLTADTSAYRDFIGYNALDAVFGTNNAATPIALWYPNAGPAESTFTLPAANGWMLVGFNKPAGSSTGTFHWYLAGFWGSSCCLARHCDAA